MIPPLVSLDDVTIGHGRRKLIGGISLGIGANEFLAIVGPNGGGKTTLLSTLLGILPPLAGGRSQPAALRVGYVPQRDHVDALWPLTTGEVVLMGRYPRLRPWQPPRAEDHEAVATALARVGILDLLDRRFGTLSGGQRQRTLIARALSAEPDLLALDEPTNGMDPAAELASLDVLRSLHSAGDLAVVMISHRIEAVVNYATRIALVDHERGLWRVGSVDEMLDDDALAALYGRRVVVREENGRRYLHPQAAGGDA
ncbi:MAG TPA: metal ABC transporter ATP-binding protein [Anaeromyxobacteraceae bacterium]|nr:metal ABC transporter ATP-binding protein [Anaeromyxobacteraceae bacterium]